SFRNCSIGTMPSDFSPALITTTSPRISTTLPVTMAPGFSLARRASLCSNSSANDSVIGKFSGWTNGPRLPWNPPALDVPCGGPAGPTRLIWCGRATPVWLVDPPRRAAGFGSGAVLPAWCGYCYCFLLLLCCRLQGRDPGLQYHRKHALDDGIDAHPGGVDRDRVGGRAERCHRAAGIACIAGKDL